MLGEGLHRGQPVLLQALPPRFQRRAGHGAGQRRPAPQRQRPLQRIHHVGGALLGAGDGHQLVELLDVHQPVRQVQGVGVPGGGQQHPVPVGLRLGEERPQPGDVALHHGAGVGGRSRDPQRLGQLGDRDGTVAAQQQ